MWTVRFQGASSIAGELNVAQTDLESVLRSVIRSGYDYVELTRQPRPDLAQTTSIRTAQTVSSFDLGAAVRSRLS